MRLSLPYPALVAALASLVAAGASASEDDGLVPKRELSSSLNYIVSFPTASTSDFVDGNVSFRGLGIEWDWRTGSSDLHLGLSLRWLYFRDVQDQGTFTVDNTTATGRLYRAVDSFPVAFHLKYPFGSLGGKVLPYVGLGVGATYSIRDLELGVISRNDIRWSFLLAPEAGMHFNFSPNSSRSLVFGVRYDAGFGTNAVSNLSLALGIGFGL